MQEHSYLDIITLVPIVQNNDSNMQRFSHLVIPTHKYQGLSGIRVLVQNHALLRKSILGTDSIHLPIYWSNIGVNINTNTKYYHY